MTTWTRRGGQPVQNFLLYFNVHLEVVRPKKGEIVICVHIVMEWTLKYVALPDLSCFKTHSQDNTYVFISNIQSFLICVDSALSLITPHVALK